MEKIRKETLQITGYIARDEDGGLYFYEHKPFKNCCRRWDIGSLIGVWLMPSEFFPEVTWEDEEPRRVTITVELP